MRLILEKKPRSPFFFWQSPPVPPSNITAPRLTSPTNFQPVPHPCGTDERYAHMTAIRIGYFSADFRNHATGHLMAELIERHDHSKFEIIGFSFSDPQSDDTYAPALENSFDRFIDVRTRNDHEIAALPGTGNRYRH